MLIVKLDFPSPKLMPNRKNGTHWTSTVATKTAHCDLAYFKTMEALAKTGPQDWPEHIPLSLLYLTPDKRHRDLDNLLAASKSTLDGMARALGVDDKRFRPILIDAVLGPKEGGLIAAIGVNIISSVSLDENTD